MRLISESIPMYCDCLSDKKGFGSHGPADRSRIVAKLGEMEKSRAMDSNVFRFAHGLLDGE